MNNTTSGHTPVRKTKIVATIGPACNTPELLKEMIEAGMNVARLNLSHGTHADHSKQILTLRHAASELGRNIAIMIDTRGIEIRTGLLEDGIVTLVPGELFSLYTEDRPGDINGVSITYQKLFEEVRKGIPILLDDGAIELEVETVKDGVIICRIIHGGLLGNCKSVNLPETQLAMSAVSPENREDIVKELSFAAENDVDYIAASFVQTADDIYKMREILIEKDALIPIIAKIENKAGVANLEEIVDAADGIMVARGDLGVELPLADVPSTQKQIIRTTVSNGKPVITATQMLASMEHNPKPTRAEASDVANAILDGTSAVMLSGETAVGKYPLEAIQTLATITLRAEASLNDYGYLQKIKPSPANVVTQAVGQASVGMAKNLKAAAIISLTESGFTSRLVSKYRPDCPIMAVTSSQRVARKLSMNWGVITALYEGEPNDDARIEFAIEQTKKITNADSGDILIVTAGHLQHGSGGTDLVRIITLQ
ncbi:MAG: pyruvate kinase [Gammaproteobacteria bacterium]|nr:pyruvate kinase [Gammaproteobacteria bacterium]MBT8133089.1 pyruvate kinase [Gammaproteobacteria bacterium]NNJ48965.1 pyruvate kinase [Gammaproteobacteria bacterium]